MATPRGGDAEGNHCCPMRVVSRKWGSAGGIAVRARGLWSAEAPAELNTGSQRLGLVVQPLALHVGHDPPLGDRTVILISGRNAAHPHATLIATRTMRKA